MPDWILVAGAASGIGKKTAQELSAAGFSLILADINKEGLEQLQKDLHGSHAITADLSSETEIIRISEYISGLKVNLSGVVFTVGKSITMPLRAMNPNMYEDIFSVNTFSFHNLIKELLAKELFSSEGASVVIISSVTGEMGAKGKIAYGASKGAINSMVKSMALELSNNNIRINAISPGSVQTEMLERLEDNIGSDNVEALKQYYPLGFGLADDVAGFATFLISSMSRWMTGTIITVDGGYSAL